MNGKRIYAIVLIAMTLLAAFGVWVMVDSAIAYRNRPRIGILYDDNTTPTTQSIDPQGRT